MAEVHVNVSPKKKSGSLPKRTVRWADRALLGFVMSIAAFVIERAVVRGSRRVEDARERKLDEHDRDSN
jgi:hypothetical protein